MKTEQIVVDRDEAAALYRKYREHRHYSTPVDLEIQRTYDAIRKGKVVVQALASIAAAGLGEDGFPKLALVRAAYDQDGHTYTTSNCQVSMRWDGGARFAADGWLGDQYKRRWIDLPPGSFPAEQRRRVGTAMSQVPLVPIHLRPEPRDNGEPGPLANYHILYEAEWSPVPPRDPLLLRRIGHADLWVVCAAWDLTEIERAVLAGRIGQA